MIQMIYRSAIYATRQESTERDVKGSNDVCTLNVGIMLVVIMVGRMSGGREEVQGILESGSTPWG